VLFISKRRFGGVMDEIMIKKAEVSEVLLLQATALEAYSDHYLHLWHDDGKWYLEKYFLVERLTMELKDLNASFYLAYYNNGPVGFLKLNIDAPLESLKEDNALELERIYLKDSTVGKGVGKKLVKLSIKVAKANSKSVVWLKAMDTSHDAISFYKKMAN
jgi:predicted GNAT family acetyltransferase